MQGNSAADLRLAKLFASQQRLSPKAAGGLLAAVTRMSNASDDLQPASLPSPQNVLKKQSFNSPPRAVPKGEVSPDQSDSNGFQDGRDADNFSSSADVSESDLSTSAKVTPQVQRWRPSDIAWDSAESSDAEEEHGVVLSPKQEFLAAVLDEAISITSEATSVDTGLPAGRDSSEPEESDDSESRVYIDSEDGSLSAGERQLAEKYKPVLSRLHDDLDLLVLRYPGVGEAMTMLLRQLAHGLNMARDSDRLEKDLEVLLGQCGQNVTEAVEGGRRAVPVDGYSKLRAKSKTQSTSASTQAKPKLFVEKNNFVVMDPKGKVDSFLQSPMPQRQHSNVGPEAEPSPCGGQPSGPDPSNVQAVDPRLQLLPEAVASAEVRCRTTLQKKLLQIVSEEITTHFEDLYARLRIDAPSREVF